MRRFFHSSLLGSSILAPTTRTGLITCRTFLRRAQDLRGDPVMIRTYSRLRQPSFASTRRLDRLFLTTLPLSNDRHRRGIEYSLSTSPPRQLSTSPYPPRCPRSPPDSRSARRRPTAPLRSRNNISNSALIPFDAPRVIDPAPRTYGIRSDPGNYFANHPLTLIPRPLHLSYGSPFAYPTSPLVFAPFRPFDLS